MSDLGRRMEQLASDLADAGAAAPNPIGDLTLLLCSGSITQVGQGVLVASLGLACGGYLRALFGASMLGRCVGECVSEYAVGFLLQPVS